MFIYIFIVFILIVTLVVLVMKIKTNIYNYFYDLYTNFNEYRLGDVYNRDAGKLNEKLLRDYHIKKFPKSLASEYLRNTNKKNNIKIMSNIIKNRLNNIPKYDYVLHIRIGDVLEDLDYYKIINEWNNNKINNEKGNFFDKIIYLRNKKYFNDKIIKLKSLNINKIYIIAGSHIKYDKYKNSSIYIDLIKNLFESNKIKCILLFKNNPDYDILLSVNANNFINSGGGFSKLIIEIRNEMNKSPSL